jgi:alpha-galactosidase
MQKKTIRTGIVGSGFSATFHFEALQKVHGANVEVVGVHSLDEVGGRKYAEKHGIRFFEILEALLDEVDVIHVCVPPIGHEPVAVAGLRRDKFVICEKPLTGYFGDGSPDFHWERADKQVALQTALKSVDRMLAAEAASKGQLLYAENWIYAPAIQKEREILEKTKGQILWIHAEKAHSGSHSVDYAYAARCGGGELIGKGCHPLSAAIYLNRVEGRACSGKAIRPKTVSARTHALTRLKNFRDEGHIRNTYYVVIDGGWRDTKLASNGELLTHPTKFPHGIKPLADYAHSKGLKFGLHTVPGTHDCGGDKVGGWGREDAHLKQFTDWGLDFIKLDRCALNLEGGWTEKLVQQTYTKWHKLIEASDRDITFSISAYNFRDWYPPVCRMARTTYDISCRKYRGANFDKTCQGIMPIALLNDKSAAFDGKGYWNDPDIMVVGEQGLNGTQGLAVEEQKTHFALWCIMTAPPFAGNDPRNMQPYEKEILLNRECIAVDQDPTEQGRQIKVDGDIQLWVKHLADKRTAVLLLNRHATAIKPATVAWKDVGLSGAVQVQDLFEKKDLGAFENSFSTELPPHGCKFLLLTP